MDNMEILLGGEYEFSDDEVKWEKGILSIFDYSDNIRKFQSRVDKKTEWWVFIREVTKPIFTQAMCDAGELPPVGSLFVDVELNDIGDNTPVLAIAHDLPLKRVVYKRGDTLIDSEYFGAVAHECKPIDTRTEDDKAFDKHWDSLKDSDDVTELKTALRLAFNAGNKHGLKFTGEK